MKKYRVERLIDNTYQILCWEREDGLSVNIAGVQTQISSSYETEEEVIFQGSLTDCNAWLQLNDKGYM